MTCQHLYYTFVRKCHFYGFFDHLYNSLLGGASSCLLQFNYRSRHVAKRLTKANVMETAGLLAL